MPQFLIARNATGNGDAADTQTRCGAKRLGFEHFHNRLLHAGAEVANFLPVVEQLGMIADEIAHGGLETAETEVVIPVVQHWSREIMCARISLCGKFVDDGPGGVGETHHLPGLVETFAGGVVNRAAEDAVFQLGFHDHEHGVAAADDERDVRLELGEVGDWRRAGNPR